MLKNKSKQKGAQWITLLNSVDAIGVGAIGVGAIGVGAIGVGAIGVGAIGVGAIGVGAIGVGAGSSTTKKSMRAIQGRAGHSHQAQLVGGTLTG